MAKPILDLNTLIDRPLIKINGAAYELYQADELSVLDSHWFTVRGQEITKAAEDDDQQRVEDLVGEVSRRCLVDCPAEVFDTLSGSQKMAICELFTRLLLQRKMRVAGAIAQTVIANGGRKTATTPAQTQTGGTSSQGSSGSSAETRTGGSEPLRRPS
ncbi:hypothetical protein [Roseibium sp.]|uniref:hypothetical protein n=1 Tax=Roseibium sp. TaxID=1936156 RepID=UPI00326466B1